MGRREMGIEDESGKCGKMPEREKGGGGLRRRRQQGRRRVWLWAKGETQSRAVGRNEGVREGR